MSCWLISRKGFHLGLLASGKFSTYSSLMREIDASFSSSRLRTVKTIWFLEFSSLSQFDVSHNLTKSWQILLFVLVCSCSFLSVYVLFHHCKRWLRLIVRSFRLNSRTALKEGRDTVIAISTFRPNEFPSHADDRTATPGTVPAGSTGPREGVMVTMTKEILDLEQARAND